MGKKKPADFLQLDSSFRHQKECKEGQSGTRVPACIADLRNMLKVHKGNLVFLSEETEDTCEVVQNSI